MTTLEDRIADLQQQAGLLLDLPQQIADTAQQRINALGAAWEQRQAAMYARHYVHQQVGDDSADGTDDAPLRSIDEAIRRTPEGGICDVRLLADYHFAAPTPTGQRYVLVQSADTVRHQVTLERISEQLSAYAARYTGGLRMSRCGSVEYRGLTLVVPALDGTWPNYTLVNSYAGHAQCGHSGESMLAMVRLAYCDVVIPSAAFCPLIGRGGHAVALEAASLVATDQPLIGNLVGGAADPVGTDPTTLPWLITNLTQV